MIYGNMILDKNNLYGGDNIIEHESVSLIEVVTSCVFDDYNSLYLDMALSEATTEVIHESIGDIFKKVVDFIKGIIKKIADFFSGFFKKAKQQKEDLDKEQKKQEEEVKNYYKSSDTKGTTQNDKEYERRKEAEEKEERQKAVKNLIGQKKIYTIDSKEIIDKELPEEVEFYNIDKDFWYDENNITNLGNTIKYSITSILDKISSPDDEIPQKYNNINEYLTLRLEELEDDINDKFEFYSDYLKKNRLTPTKTKTVTKKLSTYFDFFTGDKYKDQLDNLNKRKDKNINLLKDLEKWTVDSEKKIKAVYVRADVSGVNENSFNKNVSEEMKSKIGTSVCRWITQGARLIYSITMKLTQDYQLLYNNARKCINVVNRLCKKMTRDSFMTESYTNYDSFDDYIFDL